MAGWLMGSQYGRAVVARKVRYALTHNSELVLAPFRVEFSPWRDFPHLTVSLHNLALTDTSYRQRVPVLRIARADLRLPLLPLLRGRAEVRRLAVTDVDFQERVDSLGRAWGLRGKRRKGTGPVPTLNLRLDELVVNNFRFSSHNDYSRGAFGVLVRQAQLTARLRGGVLRVGGTLAGELSYLRTRGGTLFEREPVTARVSYRYDFRERQGLFYRTRATLNGDTIRVSCTHTVDPKQPAGTLIAMRFAGNQPLVDVLRAALPPRLESYLDGTRSPSKAHIRYTITGLSGPKVTPRNVLTFGLRGASLQWPEPARHISRWDLQGTYDNGPAHNVNSTVLTLRHCRLYSAAGQLDAALTLRDFRRPFLDGRFRGRATLPELAALLGPATWQARGGTADIDVRLRGRLPPRAGRPGPRVLPRPLSLRGTVTLHQASLRLPARGANISGLNVRVSLRDSLWHLANASGVLNQMRFQASATTVNLLGYLNGRQPTARISGRFVVDELRVAQLQALLRPQPRAAGVGFAPTSLPKPARTPRDKAQLAATLGRALIPPGLLLDVRLRCQRLVLAADTLSNLAVTVRHDGRRVQLQNLAGRVWGGTVRGAVQWPTDPGNKVAPVQYRVGVHFATLNYQQFVARLTRPVPEAETTRPVKGQRKGAALPALRELLLMANGQLNLDIDRVELPENESMSRVSLRLEKTGPTLRMPHLRFGTPEGGTGVASGTAQVEGLRLTAADADLTLRYGTLDVQRLLGLIASLTTPADSVPTARTLARAERRATRRAQQRLRQPGGNPSLFSNGVLSAVLRVEADRVSYGPVRGRNFRLLSHLLDGEARLDHCSLDALQGRISLSGYMRSTANRTHHPTQLQLRLQDVQLQPLFATLTGMGLNVLSGDNIRGSLRGVADVHTDLGRTFLPVLPQTTGYLRTDFRDLELLNVDVLMEALRFMKAERTGHLYFEPVSGEFVLAQGQLLIPGLRLNSNLSNLEISGHYGLDGATNLYVGLQPMKALFGNNDKRVGRIQNGEPLSKADAKGKNKLTYLNLRRTAPGEKYKVRLFQRDERRTAQARLLEQYRGYLRTQKLDTTVRMLRQ